MTNAAVRTCRLITLGCKVNQYEMQYVKEALEHNGYRQAEPHERADLCIINTCTVTHEADAKARQAIRRLGQANPGAAIVVMGCFATRAPQTVTELPGVTQVITDKNRLAEELRPHGVDWWPQGITRFDEHQRAFVKVQDGCLLNCTYCIIPSVRPQLKSRPAEVIEQEVAGLVERGCQEIVLTGIHLGHYGLDLSKGRPKDQWRRLSHLVERLCRLPGNFRIRLSSLEAAEVRADLIAVLAREPRVCPHLHLCLQSGSDRILRAMKRRYTRGSFLEQCSELKRVLDQPALTTDVIIGFPGETDADFEETCTAVRSAGFCKLHIFSFSPRSGTPAAHLPNRVHPRAVEERRRHLLDLESALTAQYCRSLIGKSLDVLGEGTRPRHAELMRGTSCRQVPVEFPGLAAALLGKRVPVRVLRLDEGVLVGEPEVATEEGNGLDLVPRLKGPRRLTLHVVG